MTPHPIGHRCPVAAYLYVLHLDGPALAWEYLRRNPDYRCDWRHRPRRAGGSQRWGLRLWEDPFRDARETYPVWYPDPDSTVLLYPDADPPPAAPVFAFWHMPGCHALVHDGRRLLLLARWPGGCLRLVCVPGLADGMAYVCAARGGVLSRSRYRLLAAVLSRGGEGGGVVSAGMACPRPSPTALRELHTLQALDASLAGASLRDVAAGLMGAEDLADAWHADSGLRSRVRRLVSRGKRLMWGGYRCLVSPSVAGKGRSVSGAKRP
ncbi:DUF2285 domain-containing protein [Dickeya fangzhongdai]|uniref:DUF7011 domain-containing protein n=1 Tax=Dickeya fangzhongdai TaxID=1778540 RepID=UPI001EFBC277|nr:DUF2285 domain-containing protein [Dickeya fangzhongdai]ULR32783.1 DUF2285 domain-containing protein [Dickeya fangzhongdai]